MLQAAGSSLVHFFLFALNGCTILDLWNNRAKKEQGIQI